MLSAVSSVGWQSVRAAAKQAGLQKTRIVALYGFGGHPPGTVDDVQCTLINATDDQPAPYDSFEPNSPQCPRCAIGVTAVQIEPDAYTLELAATASEAPLTAAEMQTALNFVARYSEGEAIRVHQTNEDGRHHMLHIDVAALVNASAAFRADVEQQVKRVVQPVDFVLSPRHVAATVLAERVAAQLGVPHEALGESDLRGFRRSTIFPVVSHILFVDDAVITGRRLNRYRSALLQSGIALPQVNFSCLVGVARPATSRTLRGIREFFWHQFYSVVELIVPNWQEVECPWCIEVELLDQAFRVELMMLVSLTASAD